MHVVYSGEIQKKTYQYVKVAKGNIGPEDFALFFSYLVVAKDDLEKREKS